MDMDRDNLTTNTSSTNLDSNSRVYAPDSRGGSNFLAFLIGGLVIAVGLLAFLFYDGGNSGDVNTTGSTATQSAPATPSSPSTTAPASPARPANPQ